MTSPLVGAGRPALDGASGAGIVPALLGARDDSWLPEPARAAEAVVLLVLDGLGWNARCEHAVEMPELAAMAGGPITTVVPATTASALTSIATGLGPAQHGILGYRMLVGGEVLNVLRWSVPNNARPPDPFDVQRHTAFLGRPVPVVTKTEFRMSGFTQAHLRGGRFVGWHTPAGLVEHCVREVEAGERLVYAYYPGVDSIAHEFGLHARVYRRELAAADALVGALLDALPERAALLVTADHGQVHLEPESWIAIPDLAAHTTAMAGDGRFRYLYARPGGARELLERARELFSDRAWVWSRAELLELGVLGAGATGTVAGRIGNVVLAAREAVAFVDPALPKERALRSGHGSLTPDEMYVPLLAARGTR
jgi:predicted AlkP superfamily pyrophosphatase or phosphodiesterase